MQDVISVQNKMAATAEEQRKLRNHWLAEKNDLEKRCFQLQGLNTQYEGTMRKKDKEYDKLQIQLAKLVKDSQRGQKSVITLTKPLPKNLTDPSKIAPPAPTLKDMELAEAKATIANLEVKP
jgi:predicted nuclease with TOPRIM domain